jgi:hypothetical protein
VINFRRAITDFYIRMVDKFLPTAGSIAYQGGVKVFPLGVGPKQALVALSEKLAPILNSTGFQSFLTENIDKGLFFYDLVLHFPLVAELVQEPMVDDVQKYLGKSAKLDSVCLFVIKNSGDSGRNSSGLWHHDSVGHRLKIFIPLDLKGNHDAPTEYIIGTNQVRHASYANPVDHRSGKRVCLPESTLKSAKVVRVDFGEGFIFDTNGLHRGSYNTAGVTRSVVLLQFSSPWKRFLRGYSGPVRYEIPRAAYERFRHYGILKGVTANLSRNNYVQTGRDLIDNEKFNLGSFIE